LDLIVQFIIHLHLLWLIDDLVAALLKVPPHAVAPLREGSHHYPLFDRPVLINEREGSGQIHLDIHISLPLHHLCPTEEVGAIGDDIDGLIIILLVYWRHHRGMVLGSGDRGMIGRTIEMESRRAGTIEHI